MSYRRRYGAADDSELRSMGLLYSQGSSDGGSDGARSDYGYSASDEGDSYATSGYRANDHCKRHRLRDDEPYSESVSGYSRRKPTR